MPFAIPGKSLPPLRELSSEDIARAGAIREHVAKLFLGEPSRTVAVDIFGRGTFHFPLWERGGFSVVGRTPSLVGYYGVEIFAPKPASVFNVIWRDAAASLRVVWFKRGSWEEILLAEPIGQSPSSSRMN